MARFGHGEDHQTTTVEDAARWEAMRGADAADALDDRPTAAEAEDFGIGGYTPDGEIMDAFRTLIWGPIDPQEDPPF